MLRFLRSRFAQIFCWILVFATEALVVWYSRQYGFTAGATILNMDGALLALIVVCFLVPDTVMRGRWRYRGMLAKGEKKVRGGAKGQYISVLRDLAKQSRLERYFVHYPWRIAELTALVISLYTAWRLTGSPQGDVHGMGPAWISWLVVGLTSVRAQVYWLFGMISDWRYLFAGFLPLMLAPPIILELVTRWLEKLYVLVEDRNQHTARMLFINGIFGGEREGLALESTVSTKIVQSALDFFILRGTIEFREKGGPGDRIENIYNPTRYAQIIQEAINRLKH